MKGDYGKAVADYSQAILLDPKGAREYNNLAWLLATCPQASVRDGKKAVQYALQACELSEWKDPACVDTLAAAYAEGGDFDHAVKYEQQSLTAIGNSASGATGRKVRLALYSGHKAYHQTENSSDDDEQRTGSP
jgi:tetratricopeptide (TPR) repeat protein